MALSRDKKSRQKRNELRTKFINEQKSFKMVGWAIKAAKKQYGDQATVYVINQQYYPGKKSIDEYLKGLEAYECK